MTADGDMPGRLGPYHVLDRIGEGGMGVVYLAREPEGRAVAVKVLHPGVAAEPNARARLAREVETMRRVRSPFVAEVVGADLTGEVPYIVTRYVPGRSLDQVIAERGPLRGAELALMAQGLAGALSAVHAAGVVHRDLKPGNVMLLNGSPVVIDFGIAQVPGTSRLTTTGMTMGTPGYLSPEVIEGEPGSEASDVHAWGATVAFAATGRPPFGSGNYESIFYRITSGQADLDGAPPALLPLLAAALARDPAHRPSAVQLGAQAAVLDPAALVAVPAAPAGMPAGTAGPVSATRADGQVAAPGGLAARPVADALASAQAASGQADGEAAAARLAGADGGEQAGGELVQARGKVPGFQLRGTHPLVAGAQPGDFSGVLPPVAYQARGSAGGTADAIAAGIPAEATGSPAGYRLLALATMVTAVGLSVILPVIGTLAALALIVLLRAGEAVRRGRVLRRSARGDRVHDPLVSVVAYPWFVLKSALACAIVAPVAVTVAALIGGITFAVVQVDSLARAIAFAAGTLAAFYGLGPGSSGSRRQLTRLYAAAASTRTVQAALLIAVCTLAAATVAAALGYPSLYWPVPSPEHWLHLGLHQAAAAIRPALPHPPSPEQLLRSALRAVLGHLPIW